MSPATDIPSTGYIKTACGGVVSAMGKSIVSFSHDKVQSKIKIIPKFDKNL
jgi:hypothetical protein